MPLTESDLDRIGDKVRLAIQDEVPPMIQRFVKAHAQSCAYGEELRATRRSLRWLVWGIALGGVLAGGGGVLAAVKFFL